MLWLQSSKQISWTLTVYLRMTRTITKFNKVFISAPGNTVPHTYINNLFTNPTETKVHIARIWWLSMWQLWTSTKQFHNKNYNKAQICKAQSVLCFKYTLKSSNGDVLNLPFHTHTFLSWDQTHLMWVSYHTSICKQVKTRISIWNIDSMRCDNSNLHQFYSNRTTRQYHSEGRCVIVSNVMPACFAAW